MDSHEARIPSPVGGPAGLVERPLRVTHVLASIDDPGAGPSVSVPRLAEALARQGAEVTVRSVSGWRGAPGGPESGAASLAEANAVSSLLDPGPLARRLCGSATLSAALVADAKRVDILHSHGLWLMPNIYPARAARRPDAKATLVLSPRGMLGAAALRFSYAKKRLFWLALQRRAAEAATLLHATGSSEVDEIREAGLRAPIALIPNGVDVPPPAPAGIAAHGGDREILYLGRVHPKKGIDTLIRAWTAIAARRQDWLLRIVGPPELGHDRYLGALAAELSAPRVLFEGPRYGAERLEAYRRAELFVLPTRNDNFAMTVAEALAAGLPAIVSRGAPWSGLEREGCGWWIEHGVEPLAAALEAATAEDPQRLALRGERGRAWMARDFSWDRVAAEMASAYRWLLVGGPPPATVRLA